VTAHRRTLLATLALALGIAALVAVPHFLTRSGIYNLSTWAVFSIAAIGLNLTLGYAGQVSLAQGAFVGVGAYAAAILTTAGYPLALAMVLALLLCFALGWILGYPALRVQHHYLAFVTLAFSTLAFLVFRNEVWLTGGIQGISGLPRPLLFGAFVPEGRRGAEMNYYYLCLAMLALVSLAAWWLVRSPWGRAFTALRENPVRAQSLGVDTRRYTLMAFAIGSALGGLAGTLQAPLVGIAEPLTYTLDLSLRFLMMVIVGGAGFFFGPFLGALVAVLLPEWLRFTEEYYLIIYAVLVIALLVYSPAGLLGIVDRALTARRTRVASAARAAAAPTLRESAS